MEVFTWAAKHPKIPSRLPRGFFGASTGVASALMAAARLGEEVAAVVSRGGRPDMVMEKLKEVRSPTLLIVGGNDEPVIQLNRLAFKEMICEKELEIISGATHLFEEPGALEEVAKRSAQWFLTHFKKNRYV